MSTRHGLQPISFHAGNVFCTEKPRRDYFPPASRHDPQPEKVAHDRFADQQQPVPLARPIDVSMPPGRLPEFQPAVWSPVPQGRERIAQRFIAGFKSRERSKSRRDERNEGPIGISGVDDTVEYIQNQRSILARWRSRRSRCFSSKSGWNTRRRC